MASLQAYAVGNYIYSTSYRCGYIDEGGHDGRVSRLFSAWLKGTFAEVWACANDRIRWNAAVAAADYIGWGRGGRLLRGAREQHWRGGRDLDS